MSSRELNLSDLHLVEKCVENDEAAIALLQANFGPRITAFLLGAGANSAEAQETVKSLWADCLTPNKAGNVRLMRYNGTCALQTFLNRVALNALLTRKRMDTRRERRFPSSENGDLPDVPANDLQTEAPLLELMRDAIQFAFEQCRAEEFVLLQLEYCDQLEREELARMFDCSKATVSRMLSDARVSIAETTTNFLRQRDPWLELKWEDFLELCREASPAYLGLED